MAMNVNFLKGLYSKYEGLASKDSNTFYLTYESGTNEAMGGAIRLFLGAEELTNKVDLAALREYIGTLPEGATSEDIVSYISEAITAKIGTLKIGDTSYGTVVDYVIAKTTGIATDSVVQGKADKVIPAAVNNIVVLTADGNLSDGGKTITEVEQVAKDYTDAEIIGLELVLSKDGKTLELKNKVGTSVATLDTTDFVVDGMLSSVTVDQDNNKLTFTWNTDSGLKTTTIELSSIADIYTGDDTADIEVEISNENKITASLTETVKADIQKGVDAKAITDTIESGAQVNKIESITVTDGLSSFEATISNKTATLTLSNLKVNNAENATNAALANFATSAGNAEKLANTTISEIYENALGDAKGVIQGQTTNTVQDCVDAINILNNTVGSVDDNNRALIGTVENVVAQLTWGTF